MPTVPPPPPSSRVVPKSGRAASSAEAGPAAAPPRGPGKQTTSGVFTLVEGGERAERTGAEPSGVSQLSWLTGAAAPATGRGRAGGAKLPRKRRQARRRAELEGLLVEELTAQVMERVHADEDLSRILEAVTGGALDPYSGVGEILAWILRRP